MTQPWSANRRAAKTVALNARDTVEARHLLEMIGLVEPGGTVVLPDDPRNYDTGFNGAVPGPDRDNSPIVLSASAERGDRMTTPPGIRALRAVPAPTPVKKKRTTTGPIPAAALPQPTSEVPVPEPAPPTDRYTHGTRGGYQGHRRRGEDACESCKAANRDDQRARTKAKASGASSPEERAEAVMARIDREVAAEMATLPPEPIEVPGGDVLADWELELLKENGGQALEVAVEPRAAVDLDVWIDAAQLSPTRTVRALARVASAQLRGLHRALDDLARAERAATRQGAH